MNQSSVTTRGLSNPTAEAVVLEKGIIRLFKKNFLGTNISSVDRADSQAYHVCQCCFDSGRPQGDCCPLY